MHELPIIKQVLEIGLHYARSNNAERIVAIDLEVGEFHDIIPSLARKYFAFASRGTMAENADLNIHIKPIICKCPSCGAMFVFYLRTAEELRTTRCPECHAAQERFIKISGDEFLVSRIGIV